ncbi:phage tail tape measure protein [Streptomyces sp. NPDC001156]
MPEVADLYAILRAETAPFMRGMRAAAEEGESFTTRMGGVGKTMSKLGAATTLVGVGVAAASVKMASDFQTQMTRLQTAAGLTSDKIKAIGLTSDGLNQKVLQIGSSVGVSGTKMAEALYHPISAGLDLKSALEAVKYAAEEAKISGANLDDTTYSLSSVMKAFNQPASEAKQTMASLNAIVGQGDMRFQDFNESVKNWAPTAAQMGISINSMGAGLAYLTDRGNSAEVAATRMTMGISMMTTPSAKATKMLTALGVASTDVHASSKAMQKAMEDSGITQNKLAQDLKKPDGLYVALKDLKDGLKKAGVSGTEADSVLSKIFGGGRSDKAIMSLMQNLDGLKGKFNDIQKASNTKNFDAQWEKTQHTFSNQMQKLKASAENMGISLGLKLIPPLQKMFSFLQQHKGVVDALAAVIGVVLTGAVLKFVGGALAPFGKGIVGATKGTANLIRGMRSAEAAASASTGKMGSLGGALRKGFSAAASGAKAAGRAVGGFAKTLGGLAAKGGSAAWKAISSGARAAAGAMRVAGAAALDLGRKMAVQTAAALRAAAAWAVQKVRLLAAAVAEKVTAAAQWLLNIAMDANPVMLIVLAIAGLVAVLILAYNKVGWFRDLCNAAFHAIGAAIGWVVDFVKANWPLLLGILTGPIGIAVALIVKYWDKIRSGFLTAYHATVNVGKALVSWIAGLPGRAYNALISLGAKIVSIASSAWTSFRNATATKVVAFLSYVRGLPGKALSALGNLGHLLYSAGSDLVMGLIHGVESKIASAVGTVKSLGSKIASGFKSVLGISSPSKVFRQLGIYVNEGLVDGLTASTARVKAASRRIESLLQQTYNRVADLRGTKGVSNKWVAAHEATIKRLESYAAKEDKVMRSLAAKRDQVATKIKAAQKALAAVQKQWSDEVKSVSDGVKQGFTVITTAPQEGFAMTAQDVVNHMQDQYQKAAQFAAQLRALQAKGLSSDLVAQIAAAGVDQGGATAAALAGATKGQIQQINSLQKATNAAADNAGRAVADSMYGAGVKSAQGLVKGLQSQQRAIDAQMLKIAKSMQAAIKKALGIHSPSRVFEELATWIPKGLAKGIDGSAHHATDAVNRLAGSVVGVGAGAGVGLAAVGARVGGAVVHNHVHLTVQGHVMTERDLRDFIEQQMLRLGMRNPQTYAPYKR